MYKNLFKEVWNDEVFEFMLFFLEYDMPQYKKERDDLLYKVRHYMHCVGDIDGNGYVVLKFRSRDVDAYVKLRDYAMSCRWFTDYDWDKHSQELPLVHKVVSEHQAIIRRNRMYRIADDACCRRRIEEMLLENPKCTRATIGAEIGRSDDEVTRLWKPVKKKLGLK